MPILQFVDLKGNAQSYDFSDMALCRLAAIFVAYRDLLQNKQGEMSDEYEAAAKKFVGLFDTLFVSLNVINKETDSLKDADSSIRMQTVMPLIEIETELQLMCNTLHDLRAGFDQNKFPAAFYVENKYLIASVRDDLHVLMQKITSEKERIAVLQAHLEPKTREALDKFLSEKNDRRLRPLMQMCDFFNIYHDTTLKPTPSLYDRADGAVREVSRLAASFVGSTLGVSAGFFSKLPNVKADQDLIEAAKAAEVWLKSWNDKHQAPDLTTRNKLTS